MIRRASVFMGIFLVGISLSSCQDSTPVESVYTGRQQTYALLPGDVYPVSGTAVFMERKDATTDIRIQLDGTEGTGEHPVHLHLGNISVPSADIFVVLNPVKANNGLSDTHVLRLATEEAVTYEELTELAACLKIHLAASGPEKDIILSGGNIGTSAKTADGGRAAMAVCKSN